MSEIVLCQRSLDFKKVIVDTLLAGLLAFMIFGPITGVVLDNYSFDLRLDRVGKLVAIVMIGRFCFSLFMQTAGGLALLGRFERTGGGVHVRAGGQRSHLLWVMLLVMVAALMLPFFASKYVLTVVILGLI